MPQGGTMLPLATLTCISLIHIIQAIVFFVVSVRWGYMLIQAHNSVVSLGDILPDVLHDELQKP
jgi:hypothetical protein